MKKAESPLSVLKKSRCPQIRLRGDHAKLAGKILAKQGEEAAVAYMLQHGSTEAQPNAQAPVKCEVVALSRPIQEWPIGQTSAVIQRYIYAQTKDGLAGLAPLVYRNHNDHPSW